MHPSELDVSDAYAYQAFHLWGVFVLVDLLCVVLNPFSVLFAFVNKFKLLTSELCRLGSIDLNILIPLFFKS